MYRIAKRDLFKREIRRLIVEENLTNREICERLNLKDRTMRRWLSQIFKEDNELLLRPDIEDLAIQTNIFRERLSKQRQDILNSIANNSEVDEVVRIEAHRLVAELDFIVLKLSFTTPSDIVRHFKIEPNSLVANQNNVLSLELKS
jgi:transposase-like protein